MLLVVIRLPKNTKEKRKTSRQRQTGYSLRPPTLSDGNGIFTCGQTVGVGSKFQFKMFVEQLKFKLEVKSEAAIRMHWNRSTYQFYAPTKVRTMAQVLELTFCLQPTKITSLVSA